MKSLSRYFLCTALLSGSAFAQQAWVLQAAAESPSASAYTRTCSIQFFGSAKGWAFTPAGRLLKTSDGGKNWVSPTLPGGDLKAVSFLSPDTGWVATVLDTLVNGGHYVWTFRTQDGGVTWKQQGRMPRDASSAPWDVHFTSADSGWVFSGWAPFFLTSDGGETWREIFGDVDTFQKAHFSRSGVAWLLMKNSILRKDSIPQNGRGWTQVTSFSTSQTTHAIFFADSNRGWIAGNGGSVLRTEDKGKSWNLLATGTQKTLQALYFTDRDKGWAVGDSGAALRTLDGGDHWMALPIPTTESIVAVDFTDARNGWALGSKGSIFRTDTAVVTAVQSFSGPRAGDNTRLSLIGTKLRYDLGRSGRATLTLHALDGTREAVLFNGFRSSGVHEMDLAGRGLSSGIHVLRLTGTAERAVKTIFIP